MCSTNNNVYSVEDNFLRSVSFLVYPPVTTGQPVELCTTNNYNYSVSCTFANLQLYLLLHNSGVWLIEESRIFLEDPRGEVSKVHYISMSIQENCIEYKEKQSKVQSIQIDM